MAALPKPEHGVPQAIYAWHLRKSLAEAPRSYLGWSEIGAECERALWYGFRHVGKKPTEGRMARLFETGHIEEARVLNELRLIGCDVWDRDEATGGQIGVSSHGGHFRGHADAVVLGLPEAPKTPHLVDVKTIKAKKFAELLKKGMAAMYPKYVAQAHGYMGLLNLERAAFIFVCKDDDQLHVERFAFDPAIFEQYMARAKRIIAADQPPPRLSEDPEFFGCRFCDYRDLCHGERLPAVTCRTCAHATPRMDLGDMAPWECSAGKVSVQNSRAAHDCHRFIPILLAPLGEPVDSDGDSVVYAAPDGSRFVNGEQPGALRSAELVKCVAHAEASA